jgi:hypothetical protein
MHIDDVRLWMLSDERIETHGYYYRTSKHAA